MGEINLLLRKARWLVTFNYFCPFHHLYTRNTSTPAPTLHHHIKPTPSPHLQHLYTRTTSTNATPVLLPHLQHLHTLTSSTPAPPPHPHHLHINTIATPASPLHPQHTIPIQVLPYKTCWDDKGLGHYVRGWKPAARAGEGNPLARPTSLHSPQTSLQMPLMSGLISSMLEVEDFKRCPGVDDLLQTKH